MKLLPIDPWASNHQTPLVYTVNSDNYRAPEFDTVDWANSVVILGGSDVLGIGLDDHDTISSQLSQLLSRPVINLGVSASSIQFATYNSTLLAANFPAPYAVIQMWTSDVRCMLFNNGKIDHYGKWNITQNNYMDHWIQNGNAQSQALIFRMISEHTWKPRCQYLEATLLPKTAAVFADCHLFPRLDLSHDLQHAGPATAAHIAHYFKGHII